MVDTDRDSPDTPQGEGGPPEEIPLGQRLFDSTYLLLVAGIIIFFLFYSGWGSVEMFTLPDAPLP
jgi:hypothetical protein